MATSRGATPADPTLVATTEDESLGGLFARSNVANPVQGADSQGNTVNDTTVTLNVTINGDPQTGTFTLNNSMNQEVNLTFTNIGTTTNGGPTTPTIDNHVVSGSLINNNQTLRLVMEDTGTNVEVDITALATDSDIQTLMGMITTINNTIAGLPRNFVDLGDVPALGSNGTFLGVVNNALAFTTAPNLATWTGPGVTTPNAATAVMLDASTNLVLTENGNTITITTPPAQAEAPTVMVPTPSSALETPTQAETTVTYNPEMGNTVTMVDNVMVTGPSGSITIPPENVQISLGSGSVIIPTMDATGPGDYTVMADVTTMNTVSMETETTMEDNTIRRIIPFFQSRTPPTDSTPGTASTIEWPSSNPSFTALDGTGTLYLAVLENSIPSNTISCMVGFGRPRVAPAVDASITVTLADSTTRNFDVWRFQANGGLTVSDFRNTRR